jgi:single-strand DNA-binding protein
MYDTHVTVIGNALHEPQWRKTANAGIMVATFKIASTARRFDRTSGQWLDGNSLRVRVNCWRSLATNVKDSVTRGDPLIVTGRLFTRDWIDDQGVKRIQYELEATAIGHDLSRGRAVFERRKHNTATSVIEDAEAEQRIGGELTEAVPDDEAPSQFNDVPFDVALDRLAMGPPPAAPGDGDGPDPSGGYGPQPVGALSGGGFGAEPVEPVAVVAEPDALAPVPEPVEPMAFAEPADPAGETGPARRRGLRRSRTPA